MPLYIADPNQWNADFYGQAYNVFFCISRVFKPSQCLVVNVVSNNFMPH